MDNATLRGSSLIDSWLKDTTNQCSMRLALIEIVGDEHDCDTVGLV